MRIGAIAFTIAALAAFLFPAAAAARYTPPAVDPSFVGPPAPEWMAYEPIVALPDTRAGRRAAWLIGVFKGAEFEPVESRITQRVIDEVGVGVFRDFVREGRDAAGWLFPTHIINSQEDELTLYLRSAADPERWVMHLTTTEDAPDKIDSLILEVAPTPDVPRAKDWPELAARFDSTGYDYAISVWEIIDQEGRDKITPIASINDKTPLNISGESALFVLGAITEKIGSGGGSWSETIKIREDLKSVPESPLRTTPAGVEHSIGSLAGMMLQGDDTATDHLIDWVGADRVQAFAERIRDDSPPNAPFLTTKQVYAFRLAFNNELFEQYASGTPEQRTEILSEFTPVDSEVMKLWVKPQGVDKVGHFASSRELASLLLYLRNAALAPGTEALREILGANQQFRLDSGHWRSFAFTAGAEPGVLSVGMLAERGDGRWFVISVIINNPDLPLVPHETSPLILSLVELLQRM